MRYRVYIKPFNSSGEYVDDFIEVTEDVISIGEIRTQSDNTEYNVGVEQTNGFNIRLNNSQAKFSDAGNLRSIFRVRRSDSLVKITWDFRDYNLHCGFFYCGDENVTSEVEIFEGLLEDLASTSDIDNQELTFKVLGFESLFSKIDTPSSLLNPINDLYVKDLIVGCLNQSQITDLLIVDPDNINPFFDFEIDLRDPLRDTTVKEALEQVLFASSSVLVIENRIVKVKSREPSPNVEHSFYGPGSNIGIEDIIDINKYRSGENRLFNFWVWGNDEIDLVARELGSINKYGVFKKEISTDLIDIEAMDADTKIQTILDNNLEEFKLPKTEFDLVTTVNYDTLDLKLFDRVRIDYPNIYQSSDGGPLPRYGQVNYGEVKYPFGQYTITIPFSYRFKILQKTLSPEKGLITYTLRRI